MEMVGLMKNLRLSLVAAALAGSAVVYDHVQPQAQGGFSDQRNYAPSPSTGTANAQIVALPNYGRQVGVTVWFSPGNSNTGPTTVNINNTGDASIARVTNFGIQSLAGGELVAGGGTQLVSVMWTGTYYVLTSRPPDEIGQTKAFRNTTVPNGYLFEDGSCVSQTTYSALFAAIGTTYGSCSAGLFKLPDSRGRALVALDNQGTQGAANRLTSGGSGCTATALTGTGCGSQSNALTSVNQFPSYTPEGGTPAFTITGKVDMASIFSGSLAVSMTTGNSGVKVVGPPNPTFSVAGGVGIGVGDALSITSVSDDRKINFTSDSKTLTWTGTTVGTSAPFVTLPPVSLLRLAIKI
jgi:microcystin-dependent protein